MAAQVALGSGDWFALILFAILFFTLATFIVSWRWAFWQEEWEDAKFSFLKRERLRILKTEALLSLLILAALVFLLWRFFGK